MDFPKPQHLFSLDTLSKISDSFMVVTSQAGRGTLVRSLIPGQPGFTAEDSWDCSAPIIPDVSV